MRLILMILCLSILFGCSREYQAKTKIIREKREKIDNNIKIITTNCGIVLFESQKHIYILE